MSEPIPQGMCQAQLLTSEFSATIKKAKPDVAANEQFGSQLQGDV